MLSSYSRCQALSLSLSLLLSRLVHEWNQGSTKPSAAACVTQTGQNAGGLVVCAERKRLPGVVGGVMARRGLVKWLRLEPKGM